MSNERPSRRFAGGLALALAGAVATAPSLAGAQLPEQKAQAEALFDAGRALAEEGRHEEACLKFRASQRLDPAVGTLLNLADCHVRDGETASAWALLREAADLARSRGDATREKVARDAALALEPQLSRISVVSAARAPGLVVRRDGAELDRGSFGTAVPVDPGPHVIDASAPGRVGWRTEVRVTAPGSNLVVTVPELRVEPVAAAASRDGTAQRIAAVAVGGVGLGAAILGGVVGLGARATWDDARSHCGKDGRCTPEGISLGRAAGRQADTATAAFVVGGVGLVAGVLLWLTSPSSAKETRAAGPTRPPR